MVVFASWLKAAHAKDRELQAIHKVTDPFAIIEQTVNEELQAMPGVGKPRGRAGGLSRAARREREANILQDCHQSRLQSLKRNASDIVCHAAKRFRARSKCQENKQHRITLQPLAYTLALADYLDLCRDLAICLQRDNVVFHHRAAPVWSTLDDAELQSWYLNSLRLLWPPHVSPHAHRWFWVFPVHAQDRETEVLWSEVIIPWGVQNNAPLFFYFLCGMLRRLFHSPRTRPSFCAFLQTLLQDGKYRPMASTATEFKAAYQCARERGNDTTLDAQASKHLGAHEDSATLKPAHKDAAFWREAAVSSGAGMTPSRLH